MKRYTPTEQRLYLEKCQNSENGYIDDIPNIVFPKESKFFSDFEMTHEQMAAVSEALFAGIAMRDAYKRLREVMPDNTAWQFFGNWELLQIYKDDEEPFETGP